MALFALFDGATGRGNTHILCRRSRRRSIRGLVRQSCGLSAMSAPGFSRPAALLPGRVGDQTVWSSAFRLFLKSVPKNSGDQDQGTVCRPGAAAIKSLSFSMTVKDALWLPQAKGRDVVSEMLSWIPGSTCTIQRSWPGACRTSRAGAAI
jgi:hypothetical protein